VERENFKLVLTMSTAHDRIQLTLFLKHFATLAFRHLETTVTNKSYIQEDAKVNLKAQAKFSLYLTEHQAMKAYWEWRYNSTHS
jgi:hypothetical protein